MKRDSAAEEAFVAQVLLNPDILIHTTILPEMLGEARRARIFAAARNCAARGIKPDYILLRKQDPDIDVPYMMELTNSIGSSANWEHYQAQVREDWLREKLEKLGKRLVAEPGKSEDLFQMIDEELGILHGSSGRHAIVKLKDALALHLRDLDDRYNNRGRLPGIPTGIDGLDRVTMGLQKGLLYVIGARPSQGKSALALNMAGSIAIDQKLPVGFLSAESSNREIINRLLSSNGTVNGTKIASGFMSQEDIGRIGVAAEKMYEAPFFLWDQPNAKLGDLRSTARFMKRRYDVKVLFIDYAQIVQVPGALDRRAAAEAVSMEVKVLARDLDIPIVLLAQLGRAADEKRPTLADFQWSSQFEQDADFAGLLWHRYNKDSIYEIDESFLLAEKARDGHRGKVRLKFEMDYVRFRDEAESERKTDSDPTNAKMKEGNARRMPYKDD